MASTGSRGRRSGELVANAYDADASYVVIETGQPEFERMTVHDDGIGMTPKTLAYVLNNIGGSSKRTAEGADLQTVQKDAHDTSPGGRKLIGKIGIGLFAVAQLTQHFQIITKTAGEGYRISATIRLKTHDEEQLQKGAAEYVAGDVAIISQKVPKSERPTHGTSVVLYHMRPEVRRILQSAKRWEARLGGRRRRRVRRHPPNIPHRTFVREGVTTALALGHNRRSAGEIRALF